MYGSLELFIVHRENNTEEVLIAAFFSVFLQAGDKEANGSRNGFFRTIEW